MDEYTLEKCSLYKIKYINEIAIVIFDEHNMALPVWGTFSSRTDHSFNLVSFDFHTDTYPPFNAFLCDRHINQEYGKSVFKIPAIKHLLKNYKYNVDDFSFEDMFKLSCSVLKNTEQILTACAMEYLDSYTIIHRDNAYGYERADRLNGLNARYIEADNFSKLVSFDSTLPIALDFDLDYFRSIEDLNEEFFNRISSLIKNASVITIAREPKYFESCKTDSDFSVQQAEEMLIKGIEKVLQ